MSTAGKVLVVLIMLSAIGCLILAGTGTANIPGANTYTGTTTLTSGMVIIENSNSLSTGSLALGSATLVLDANYTVGTLALTGSGGYMTGPSSFTLPALFTVSGTGNATITAPSSGGPGGAPSPGNGTPP